MGGACSKRSVVNTSHSVGTSHCANVSGNLEATADRARGRSGVVKINNRASHPERDAAGKQFKEEELSSSEVTLDDAANGPEEGDGLRGERLSRTLSYRSRLAKSQLPGTGKAGATKVSEVSSMLGRAGTVGFGKAVEVLDTLGSSMTNLNVGVGFISGANTKGNKISILAFEVANTIVKGSNLMQSLSKESIKHLTEMVLPSEGVQLLVSKDMDKLLKIAARDKRNEFKVFTGEVVRFGNRCKDPQWHNLDRYFEKLGSEVTPQTHLKEEVESTMQQLMTLVQCTAELYHELHALDRFEQDYQRKLQEEKTSNTIQKEENLQILKQELKSQRKHVKSLKKRSLWFKNLEELMEKLVDIVHFVHAEIHETFGDADSFSPVKEPVVSYRKLGPAGLSLHYANLITQIDTLVSRSTSVPPNTRDALYQGLPPSIKDNLRSQLQLFQADQDLSVPQIKAEIEKILHWLLPMANNTTKAHHGFGWVGEWANMGADTNRKPPGQMELLRIETLYHADKKKTESYILDLVVWLHNLISQSKPSSGYNRSPIKSPPVSPSKTLLALVPVSQPSPHATMLTQEDHEMLRAVTFRRFIPRISRSQEFDIARPKSARECRLVRSSSYSICSGNVKESFPARRLSMLPIINFDIDKNKALDMIDRVHDVMNS